MKTFFFRLFAVLKRSDNLIG